MRTVIIDDEAPARSNLTQIINDNFNWVDIVGEAESVETGVALIQEINPELVLLDINLTDGSGFNILEQLSKITFKVIFVTAYDNYAIKAFKFNALDYILKPIELKQLRTALDKAKESLNNSYITKEELNVVLDNYTKKEKDRKIALNDAKKISYIAVKDIYWLKGDANYTTFYLNDGTNIITSKTLKSYESLLPDGLFYRTHQSSIINLDYVKEYRKEDGGIIVLKNDEQVPIARRRKDDLLELLNQRMGQ